MLAVGGRRRAVAVFVAVVKLEGDLCTAIQGGGPNAGDNGFALQSFAVQNFLERFFGHTGRFRRVPENLMVHVHTSIQNGNPHALAVVPSFVIGTAANHAVAGAHGGHQLEAGSQEGRGNLRHLPDLLQLAVCDRGGEAVEECGIGISHFQGGSVQDFFGDFGLDAGLPVAHGAQVRRGDRFLVQAAVIQQDDDVHRLVFWDGFWLNGLGCAFSQPKRVMVLLGCSWTGAHIAVCLRCQAHGRQTRQQHGQDQQPGTDFFHVKTFFPS